jgi:drug/metabolite transporter (DMT)-like permease
MLSKFIIMGIVGDCMSLCGLLSGTYSIMTHSFIFNNLGGCLIVVYSILMRKEVHKFEILGTCISFLGCIITVLDGKAKKVDPS